MAVFEYKALTKEGKTTKGLQEGDSERQIRQILRDKGLTPVALVQIEKKNTQANAAKKSFFVPKLKVAELALFTRELYTLLDASTPLKEALKALSTQSESKQVARFITSLHTHVSEGYSLANAMSLAPVSIPRDIIATIQAGEESGHLDKVLSRLAESVEQQDKLNKKMKTALIYPMLMVVVAIVIVFLLMIYVVPKMVSMFDSMQQTLPPLTQGMLSLSAFIQAQWPLMLVVAIAVWLGNIWAMKRPKWRFAVHSFLLKIPGLKRFLVYSATARWSRTFGVLVLSGVAIKDALKISAEVMTLDPMKKGVLDMVEEVREGKPVHHAMKTVGFFPPLLLNLVKTGEGKGQLDTMLIKGAEHYENAVESAATALMSILEPVLIVVMGGIVLTIVMAIMMPMFEMNQMVGQ
ncbi:MAG: type II secretion system F family protein [Thiomicrorhabdus sp.]|nr:type II secretion system F family protein [Thiomicrorhabdus sp.]